MNSLRTRLIASFFAVISIGMLAAAGVTWLGVEQLYVLTQRENLLAQAERVAKTLPARAELTQTPITEQPTQNLNVLPGINTRVLDADGTLLIDGITEPSSGRASTSASSAPGTDTLLTREEIRSALLGQSASAVRQSPVDANRRVIYAAAPVPSTDGRVRQVIYITTPLPATSALLDAMRTRVLGAAVLALLLAGATGVWLSNRLATPIRALAHAADAVAAGNALSPLPKASNIQELDALSHAFNRMTASLRQSDQARTAFVADVSHELRTPLTVIKGAVETIQDNPDDLDARTRFLGAIGSETDRLIRLVNDLLVLTRADAGALQLQRTATDIGAYVQTRITLFQPLAQRANIELAVESAAPGLCASIDTHRLAQVLDNLLDNALRHTPAAGRILVRVSADDSTVRCEVSDSGRGIEAQHLARVFDRFYRADASRARHSGGSGLGLSIAQALVNAQGGQMRVSSVPGQGSVFEFSLPRVSCLQTDTH